MNALSLRPEPLPQNVAEDCPRAADFLRYDGTIAAAELMVLDLGLALNECGDEKQLAVSAYDGVAATLQGKNPK